MYAVLQVGSWLTWEEYSYKDDESSRGMKDKLLLSCCSGCCFVLRLYDEYAIASLFLFSCRMNIGPNGGSCRPVLTLLDWDSKQSPHRYPGYFGNLYCRSRSRGPLPVVPPGYEGFAITRFPQAFALGLAEQFSVIGSFHTTFYTGWLMSLSREIEGGDYYF